MLSTDSDEASPHPNSRQLLTSVGLCIMHGAICLPLPPPEASIPMLSGLIEMQGHSPGTPSQCLLNTLYFKFVNNQFRPWTEPCGRLSRIAV